ncbi:hypothetical protein Tco_0930580, partial [Tanacetum coccineum]
MAAIWQLVADSVATALKAQAANMENTDNTNKNTGTSRTPVARKGINNHKRKFEDRGNTTNNNNYPKHNNNNHSNNRNNYQDNNNKNNHNNDYHQQQNRRQETVRTYPAKKIPWKPPFVYKMHPTSHRSLHCQVSNLQQGGSFDQELQKQRTSHGKQPAISICNLSCLWRERALQ